MAFADSFCIDPQDLTDLGIGQPFKVDHTDQLTLTVGKLCQNSMRFLVDRILHDRIFIELRRFHKLRVRVERVDLARLDLRNSSISVFLAILTSQVLTDAIEGSNES